MATKKAFVAKHGLNVGTNVVFGKNGKLHANNTIQNGTITDDMLAGDTADNLSKINQVEANLLATNTAIRSTITSNDAEISALQSEDSSLWSAITATNTAIRSLVTSNDSDISALQTRATNLEGTDIDVTLTGAVTGSGTITNLGDVSISTTATSDPTLTLSGDVSGSATFTNLGNATLSATVANDSHNHSSSSGAFTVGGDLTVSGGDITLSGTGRIQGVDTVSSGTDAANKTYVDNKVANLVDSAPAALDTLNELAAALGDDASFATTVSTNLGQKLGGTASVALTGDITGSGSFSANAVSISTSLATNSVGASEIAANAVGASELNVTGNGTAGQYLASDGDGTMTWTTLSTDPSMGGDLSGTASNAQIVAGAVGTSELAADCVTAAKIGNDVINSEHYAAGSIDNEHLAADCVNGSKIANDSINSEHYVDGSIDAAHLASNSVTAAKIAANSVDSSELVDNSVDASHLNVSGNGTTSQFLRSDGDGTFTWATPTDTNTTYSAGSGLDLSGTTFSVEADLRDGITHVGRDSNDYWACNTTSHDWYLDGALDMRLENDGDLHVDGDVIAYSTTTSSDRKLKDDITNVENAIDKVKQLNGVEFTWKESGKKSAGVIAQDVEEVLPQAVKEVNDLNGGDTHKTVNYDSLHAILIEAIKEQQKQIEELQAKLK